MDDIKSVHVPVSQATHDGYPEKAAVHERAAQVDDLRDVLGRHQGRVVG